MKKPRLSGANGPTEIIFTPQMRDKIDLDVLNCPHCGRGHASLSAKLSGSKRRVLHVHCPATGGRPIRIDLTFRITIAR